MKRRILILDDSPLYTQLVKSIVNGTDGFEICGCATDPYEAVTLIEKLKPDMLILDVELPVLGGAKFLRKLIPQYAIPVIACTTHKGMASTMLTAGAADFVLKPDGSAIEEFRGALRSAMANAANLREITCEGKVYKLRRTAEKIAAADRRLILIGGSAGSTEALPVVLKGFDSSMPPTAVTLHLPPGYTSLFVERLKKECSLKVCQAVDGMALEKGMVVIAEGAKHMRIVQSVTGYAISSKEGEKISGHCPSVDALFTSAAELRADRFIAVLLTGMGYDGADGMLKLRKAGAYTIGQDEKTSMVYGMPRAAFEAGAVEKQSALGSISFNVRKKLGEWK
ncbi:two-component system, chemotaxis family, response regulator CheB [Ruminococcus sp. YE71]|uniref:chemotaxis protein CheB n=1 Tax=unclassified Ruminococcus TaxID=2608920 RepID=UPI00088B2308|nr:MULTISPECIES: chemotaxis protein CheB [unclassified Ruminococcus]SDA16174.1 two-component system, chemotaxis family, response regulator CheB [Ruminococcus sp. YE78]SFW24111.1 two-component system, chemotaxis family, response regulator CheB [Ruminococcus sp. YE71]